MRINELKALDDSVIITIDLNQLYASLKALNMTTSNQISPIDFKLQTDGQLDDTTKALLTDEDFKTCLEILCQPKRVVNIKGHHEKEGDFASTLCIGSDKTNFNVVWVNISSDGATTFTTFKDVATWLNFYIEARDYKVDYPHRTPLDITFDASSFMLFLHSMDVYKNAYYSAMLKYSSDVGDVVKQDDFFGLLELSAKSSDRRWLLPCALTLTDWGKQPEIEYTANSLATLLNGKILKAVMINETNRGFSYDVEGLFLAIEYAALKRDTSIITIHKEEGTVTNYFMISTDEAIHLYDITEDSQIKQDLLTSDEFYQQMLKLMA